MANTDVVLQGVKDYTLELLGTKARDEAAASADRSESAATRAEAAATRSEGAAESAMGDAAATAADRVATGEDRAQTGRDVEAAEGWASQSKDAATLAITAAATVTQYVGDGFPEGRVTAPVGAVYTDTAATAGAVRWIKTTGTGNTGWQVEYGDTGLRNITNLIAGITAGKVLYQRKNGLVALTFEAVQGSGATTFSIPGSRAKAELRMHLFRGAATATPTLQFVARPLYGHGIFFIDGQTVDGEVSWDSNDVWASTRPGTPA